ncbi:MAG: hypothetical protein SFY80_01295 [Verrucomicrobiota bacterium]|nr:hypothetical protein [Verrucomicrobiota bacterium]
MKNTLYTVAALTLVTFAVGCKPKATDTTQTASQQIDQVKRDTKEIAQDIKDYSYAQRTEFTASMQAQLDALDREMDAIAARIEKSSDKVKADAKPKLAALRAQVDSLNKQLELAKGSSESAWADIKSGFKKGYNELKDGINNARQWTSEQIAP